MGRSQEQQNGMTEATSQWEKEHSRAHEEGTSPWYLWVVVTGIIF